MHGNQTVMEDAFEEGGASWEITRYSGVDHGYTIFSSPAYNLAADARSWKSMLNSFHELLAVPQLMDEKESGVSVSGLSAILAMIVALYAFAS